MKNYLQSFRLFKQIFKNIGLPKPGKLYSAMFPGVSPITNVSRLIKDTSVKQLTPTAPHISDHRWYASTVTNVMAGNLMKQGRTSEKRTNNAFRLHETAEDYKQRLGVIANTICEKIKLHPDIGHLSFQEAPIKEHYEYFKEILQEKLPNTWKFHNSKYGVLTIINTEKYHCEDISETLNLTADMDFGEKDNRYKDDRFRSFKVMPENEEPWVLTNIHVPHDNKGTALKNLIVNVLKHHLANLPKEGVQHVICGDWNATPEELDAAYEEASEEIKDIIQSDSRYNHHVNINTTLSSSVHGHQKALKPGQDKPDHITVDGVLTINISHGDKYESKYKHSNFAEDSSVGLSVAILASAGLLLTNSQKQKNNDKEAEQEEQIIETEGSYLRSPKNI